MAFTSTGLHPRSGTSQSKRRGLNIRSLVLFTAVLALLILMMAAAGASAAQAYTISGTVTAQATGLGVAETTVVVSQTGTGTEVANTITALDGSYSVEVPEGTYDITFTPPTGSGYERLTDRGEQISTNKVINIVLEPVSGTVTFSGVLRDEGGVPLPNDEVLFDRGGSFSVTRTGSDGSFSISLPAGTYELSVQGSRPVASHSQYFIFYGAQVTLTSDVSENLTLPVHVLTVKALGSTGEPLAGVGIKGNSHDLPIANGALAPGITATGGYIEESATTGEDGTATLSLPDFTSPVAFEAIPPAGTTLVRTPIDVSGITEDEARELQLANGVTFSGVLRDEGGVPLPNDEVLFDRGGSFSVTRTGSDGSFSISLPAGTYELSVQGSRPVASHSQYFIFYGAQVTLTSDVSENLTLPVHVLTVKALGSTGEPLAGVGIKGNSHDLPIANGALAPGITATGGYIEESATTGEDGTATLSLPDFTSPVAFEAIPPAGTTLVRTPIDVSGITEDEARELQLANGVTFSGVLRDEGGVPLPNDEVLFDRGGSFSVTRTGSDGSFSISLPAGTYELSVQGSRPVASHSQYFIFYGAQVTLTSDVSENLTLPVHVLTVKALGSTGEPLAGVGIKGNSHDLPIANGALAPGITATGGYIEESATTGEDGTATLSLPDFTSPVAFEAIPPAGTLLARASVSVTSIANEETRILAYPYFAKVPSAGDSSGAVEVSSPPETTLSAVSAEPATGLPEGAVAVIGSLSYQVSHVTPGGSIEVVMQLPPGSNPTNVYKLIKGSYVNVTSIATISGNTITLHLTDGGLGDEDGEVNGVIVDPIVPVRIEPRPAVTGLSIHEGPAAGGTSVKVTGNNFAGATKVKFGTTAVTASCTAIECSAVSPAGSGTVDVTVTNAGGTSLKGSADHFSYVPAPLITKVTPNTGPGGGGTSVTIKGTGFVPGATVEIGQGSGAGPTAIPASKVVVVSATEITATTGGSAKAGTWNLFVIDSGGTSPANTGDDYTYIGGPTVSSVSPASGTVNGGTPVTIKGTGFVPGATVEIGQGSGAGPTAIPASKVVVVSATEITATTGGSAKAGTWNLFVIDSGGTSPANTGDDYTYIGGPTVSSVSPASGTVNGGTPVTIKGTGFVPGATVEIGQGSGAGPTAIPASKVVVVSATEITATTGGSAKAGTWNLFVIDSGGTSPANTGDDYTYK